jgi:hypothetical protein
MKRLRTLAISLCAVALMSFIMLSPVAAAGTTHAQAASTPHALTQTVTGTTTSGDTFNGTYTITKFVSQGSKLFATGTVSGTLENATGTSLGTVSKQAVSVPVSSAVGSCSILTLFLGSLHLNILGLNVDLNPVLLVITSIPGAGNLLGNLLCAVAGLLNGGLPLGGLSGLLNGILLLL